MNAQLRSELRRFDAQVDFHLAEGLKYLHERAAILETAPRGGADKAFDELNEVLDTDGSLKRILEPLYTEIEPMEAKEIKIMSRLNDLSKYLTFLAVHPPRDFSDPKNLYYFRNWGGSRDPASVDLDLRFVEWHPIIGMLKDGDFALQEPQFVLDAFAYPFEETT